MPWSSGWKALITSSLVNSSLVTLFITLMMLKSFLYHVTVGRGEPLAEQLIRRVSRIPGAEIDEEGVLENSGGTSK